MVSNPIHMPVRLEDLLVLKMDELHNFKLRVS